MKRFSALAVLTAPLMLTHASSVHAQLPVSSQQTAEIGKRCKKDIAGLNAYLGGSPVSLDSPGILHDLATSTDASAINHQTLTELDGARAKARRDGEGDMAIAMADAMSCVLRERLSMSGKTAGDDQPGNDSGPATASAELSPQCNTLQQEFDRSEERRKRYEDEMQSGRFLANKFSGDKLVMELGETRKRAEQAGCPKVQVDWMKEQIKHLKWVLSHTTRF